MTTSTGLARLLLHRYGAAALPSSAFGEPPGALRLRLATAMLYGNTPEQQEAALTAPDPTALPPTAAALNQLHQILADLAAPASAPPRLPWQARRTSGSDSPLQRIRGRYLAQSRHSAQGTIQANKQ